MPKHTGCPSHTVAEQRCAPWTFVESLWVGGRFGEHAESAALATETRAALLDARQTEARAIALRSIGKFPIPVPVLLWRYGCGYAKRNGGSIQE